MKNVSAFLSGIPVDIKIEKKKGLGHFYMLKIYQGKAFLYFLPDFFLCRYSARKTMLLLNCGLKVDSKVHNGKK